MKRSLTYVVVALSFIGGIAISVVFSRSMQPSAKAKSQRSQHDISTLEHGRYRIEPFGRDSAWDYKVLLIHDWDGKFYAYLLPTDNGNVVLPDRWWGLGYYQCTDFRPELNESRTIRKGGIIKCHDKDTPDWGKSLWEWAYDGTPKSEWGINMYSPPVEVVGGTLYINK